MPLHRMLILWVVFLGFVTQASAELEPSKTWFTPGQPIMIKNTADEVVELRLTDFIGKIIDAPREIDLQPGEEIDVTDVYQLRLVNAYLLYAVTPDAESLDNFIGTPLVIDFRGDHRPGATNGAVSIKVTPLEYADIQTDSGLLRLAFYYNAAPRTVFSFLDLARGGFYNGLTFNRVLPGYLIQGGDSLGDGTGGPGFRLAAEFSDLPLLPGTVAMSRVVDPLERQGAMPRQAAADSAGSQFFILLDPTKQQVDALSRRYTVFARVIDGMDVLGALGKRTDDPPVIQRIDIRPVTSTANPYTQLLSSPFEGSLLDSAGNRADVLDDDLPTTNPAPTTLPGPTTDRATSPTKEPEGAGRSEAVEQTQGVKRAGSLEAPSDDKPPLPEH